jgi:hypothetical protein
MAMAWHGEQGRYTKPLEITARRMLLMAGHTPWAR